MTCTGSARVGTRAVLARTSLALTLVPEQMFGKKVSGQKTQKLFMTPAVSSAVAPSARNFQNIQQVFSRAEGQREAALRHASGASRALAVSRAGGLARWRSRVARCLLPRRRVPHDFEVLASCAPASSGS